jgi:hypothetical protein
MLKTLKRVGIIINFYFMINVNLDLSKLIATLFGSLSGLLGGLDLGGGLGGL